VVLLGDTCCAVSLPAGHGAYVLAEHLRSVGSADTGAIGSALERHERR
jgi:hypothetical protein